MHANALRMQLRLRVHIHHPQPPPRLLLPVRRHAPAMRMHLLITFHLLPTLAHLPTRAPPPAFTYTLLLLTAIQCLPLPPTSCSCSRAPTSWAGTGGVRLAGAEGVRPRTRHLPPFSHRITRPYHATRTIEEDEDTIIAKVVNNIWHTPCAAYLHIEKGSGWGIRRRGLMTFQFNCFSYAKNLSRSASQVWILS